MGSLISAWLALLQRFYQHLFAEHIEVGFGFSIFGEFSCCGLEFFSVHFSFYQVISP
jgi:hypothetical protein